MHTAQRISRALLALVVAVATLFTGFVLTTPARWFFRLRNTSSRALLLCLQRNSFSYGIVPYWFPILSCRLTIMIDNGHPRRYMIAAFEGWNDASQAATNVIRHLLDVYPSREIGHICCDDYYDFQVSRPMMCVVQGRKQIIWPETTLYELTLDDQPAQAISTRAPQKLYVAMGPEPNLHWSDFCQRMMHFADECDVTDIITLGSMYSDVPHTRALPVFMSDGDDDVAEEDTYTGPVGIPTVLNISAAEEGFESHSLWVAVPQYMGHDDCDAGTLRLLEEISALTEIDIDEAELASKAERWRRHGDMLMATNDQLQDYIHHIERNIDTQEAGSTPSLSAPHAKRLVEETEEFLRSFDNPAAL